MANDRQAIGRQGDVPLERAAALLLREGDLGRHTLTTRRIHQARRDLFVKLPGHKLGQHLDFTTPDGGLTPWTCLKPGLNAERLSRATEQPSLAITQGRSHFPNVAAYSQPFRLGFARRDNDELRRSVQLLLHHAATSI